MSKTWKQMWTEHLQDKYEEAAERWGAEWDQETDKSMMDNEKVVFNIMYHQMKEALDSLQDDPQTLVRSAVTSRFEQMQKAMDEILQVYA